MKKKKLGIREILALNLKLNRQKCGLTQEKLAEKARISANYLSMVEISKKFPTPDILERLANALEIETFQLFDGSANPEGALNQLEQSLVSTIRQAVKEAVKDTLNDEGIVKRNKK